jgi:nitrate/nitrite-specific signal transduction histidine kinase
MEIVQGVVMTAKTRRKQYSIVDRSLQYKVLAVILIYSLIIVLFLAVCLFIPDILTMNNQDLSLEIRAAAADRLLTLHSRVWPAIVAMVCVLGIHSVRIFHRLIGPLYRFRWAFSKIENGDLSFRVQIRKSDYLHREEEALNQMIAGLSERCESLQLAGLKAEESLSAIEQTPSQMSGGQDSDQQLLQEHRQHLANLLKQVQSFRLSGEDKVEDETG